MKEDEKLFLMDVLIRCWAGFRPRQLINEPGFYMNHKRAWYLLEKWGRKDWYEWGVTMDLGWLTDEGIAKAKEMVE